MKLTSTMLTVRRSFIQSQCPVSSSILLEVTDFSLEMEIRLEKNFKSPSSANKCIQGEIEAIIKSVFALSLQGFYKSVKMLMTNPVSLCGGKKGLLFAIALLQLVGAKSWEGQPGKRC